MNEPPVVDTHGDGWLAGLPYADQIGRIDSGEIVSASLRPAGPHRVRFESPAGGAWDIPHVRPALGREPGYLPRPWPPPEQVMHWGRPDPRVPLPLEGSESLGSGPFADIATTAATARLVRILPWGPSTAPVVVGLCGMGVVCSLESDEPVSGLGERLTASLRIDPAAIVSDKVAWAAARAAQSRAAWLDHDLWIAWEHRDGGWRPRISPLPLPSVSVLLASRRPELVPTALDQIARQTTVAPEVVLGLHGATSADAVRLRQEMRDRGLDGHVLEFDSSIPLGGVLTVALEQASGEWVTKWDDDDLYGPHHLEDLVVAARRSGAPLVGKRAEFVHLTASNQTLFRTPKGADRDADNIAGATLFGRRDTLIAVGGFAPTVMSNDYFLRGRFAALGLRVHRTHGFGFVMVRNTAGHTWQISEEKLRKRAVRTWDGLPDIADIG